MEIFIACMDKLTFSDTKAVDSGHSLPPPPSPPPKATGRQSKTSQKEGWYTDKEFNRLFDPDFKAPKHPDTGEKPSDSTPKAPAKPKKPQKPTGKLTPGKPSKPGLQVQTYTIRMYVPRKRDFKRPASRRCKETCHLQANVNIHVKNTRPNFQWQCSYCTAKYKTYNAAYKQ